MQWKDTDIACKLFDYNTFKYYQANGRYADPFIKPRWWYDGYTSGYIYPNKDLSGIKKLQTTTINPQSTLYFDSGSTFPRFKLGLTGNKRCIKIPKANYIVVSGATNYKTSENDYIVLQDDRGIYLVRYDEYKIYFRDNFTYFVDTLKPYIPFKEDLKIIYTGKIKSYEKDSIYLAKYADGEYTVPYITDIDLDKVCCNMCPEPTEQEFLSIIDMLDSEDASVVQLGVKMLAAYNIDKYKLSFRLILCTRRRWFEWSGNLVACKQLMDTLGINRYNIYDNFANGCRGAQRGNEKYAIEDITIAKKLASKFIKDDLQNYLNRYYANENYTWLPDEKTVELT